MYRTVFEKTNEFSRVNASSSDMELSDTDRRETAESFVTKTEPDHGSATPVDILIRILSYLPLFHISPPQAPEFWKFFDLFGKKTHFCFVSRILETRDILLPWYSLMVVCQMLFRHVHS